MSPVNTFVFTKFARKKFLRLEKAIQERIREKLLALKHHDQIDAVLKGLTNVDPATHRIRIGQYRVIVQRRSEREFLILDIGHRKDIYR